MMLEARGQKVPDKEKWISDIRAFYGDDAAEELDVIPAQGTGTVLSGALIEQRMDRDVEVLRWERPPSFGRVPLHVRQAEAKEWCEEMLAPRLENLPALRSFFGEDFGRVGDLTVIWPLQMQADLVRRPPFVVELSNIPFEQQKQVLFFILRRLPNFMAGAMDASGNGAWLAEATADEFGHDRIAQVKLSVEWYRENMPRFVAAFQDGLVVLPKDADVLGDHRLLRKVDGVVRVPALRTQDLKNRDKKRHGDSAIAHAMAYHASLMEVAPIEFMSSGDSRRGMQAFQDSNESGGEMNLGRGYGVIESGSNWRGY
jgi:phage FluMu gp28-like protein